MELPIDDKDLSTILSALSLGGDARLYHLLKDFKETRNLTKDVYESNSIRGAVQIYSESDDYQCKNGACDI